MTYIWDEKPEWETISESYPRIAMDAWLETVKFLYEALTATTIEQNNQLEAVKEWAFNMECMHEDCTYLSHEAFYKDARSHLKKLVELVGKWIPPEIRDSSQEATE